MLAMSYANLSFVVVVVDIGHFHKRDSVAYWHVSVNDVLPMCGKAQIAMKMEIEQHSVTIEIEDQFLAAGKLDLEFDCEKRS